MGEIFDPDSIDLLRIAANAKRVVKQKDAHVLRQI